MQIDQPPDTSGPNKAYRDWKIWDEERFGHSDTVEARYFEAELTRSGVVAEAGMPLLEIGFGNGNFAAWADSRQFDYTGTELDPKLVERARKRGWRAFPATLSLDALDLPSPLSCIVAFDVLEHLTMTQITQLLGAATRVLAPGGLLLVRLPSGDSPFAGYIQHGDITHRTALGSSAVRQLAEMSGLEVVQIRAPVLPLRGVGWRRGLRRVGVLAVRWLLTRCIRLAFHDNQPTVVTANMLVVLRKAESRSTAGQSA